MATIPADRTPSTIPTKSRFRWDDGIFRSLTTAAGGAVLAIVIITAYQLVTGSLPALEKEGLGFLTGSSWNVGEELFGSLPFVWGTTISSILALVLGGSIGVMLSAFLVELAPKWLLKPIGFLVDLLAAIPSIIYGLWGILVLIPFLRERVFPEIHAVFGWTGLFGEKSTGTGLLTAGIVLAIMIIPTVAAITREVLLVVPRNMRDGALALGANRTEALKTVMLPYASGGILGALILGLGRALGETMAVAMVIGNSATIESDLFKPAASLASNIATEFGEAGPLQKSALIGLGLILFILALALNFAARMLVARVRRKSGVQ